MGVFLYLFQFLQNLHPLARRVPENAPLEIPNVFKPFSNFKTLLYLQNMFQLSPLKHLKHF
jgi:hypothetical protein